MDPEYGVHSQQQDILRDVTTTGRVVESVVHAASTKSSILKLSGGSGVAPLCDGSRWGHHIWGSNAPHKVEVRSFSGHSDALLPILMGHFIAQRFSKNLSQDLSCLCRVASEKGLDVSYTGIEGSL